MPTEMFINRDISWLYFNSRVLEEAASNIPLMERLKFLAIFSSNLDEFYRVRMPVLKALRKIKGKRGTDFDYLNKLIYKLQFRFGQILDGIVIPLLKEEKIIFISNENVPDFLHGRLAEIYRNQIHEFIRPIKVTVSTGFFPENNKLYVIAFGTNKSKQKEILAIPVPIERVPRFFHVRHDEMEYIIFIEDIIKLNLQDQFSDLRFKALCNIKMTRDSDLNLEDEYETELASKIEEQLKIRDLGAPTRLLYEPCISKKQLEEFLALLNLPKKYAIQGGPHHSYKDLFSFPINEPSYKYPVWDAIEPSLKNPELLTQLLSDDLMVHTPYHDYKMVIRFFKEAARNPSVTEIYTTIYRVATESKILKALIKAAKRGKKVTVIVELKARFDEANNLKWSKKLKKAGVKIIYSGLGVKVHAKIALLKYDDTQKPFIGLLATGNLNENTAKIYTDHILMTSHIGLLKELFKLFQFLEKKQKPEKSDSIRFRHLLVAQFNLKTRFQKLIDNEIALAKAGKTGSIVIKLNNLEEEGMIRKLYSASRAGVKVELIVRGICCLKPGVKGISDNIRVHRIVDRYLEHGRIFIFNNNGNPLVYAGSADWMIRNIYRRIEVCFPILNERIKQELMDMVTLQLKDNAQAVLLGGEGQNIPVVESGERIRSQEEIYKMLRANIEN
jgi:polyphosphate kinase